MGVGAAGWYSCRWLDSTAEMLLTCAQLAARQAFGPEPLLCSAVWTALPPSTAVQQAQEEFFRM